LSIISYGWLRYKLSAVRIAPFGPNL
jgi:hypothetical protein